LFNLATIINKNTIRRNMGRKNRRAQGGNNSTISVVLPQECIIALNRYTRQTGYNRSLALEYIIKDWERMMQAQRRKKNEL